MLSESEIAHLTYLISRTFNKFEKNYKVKIDFSNLLALLLPYYAKTSSNYSPDFSKHQYLGLPIITFDGVIIFTGFFREINNMTNERYIARDPRKNNLCLTADGFIYSYGDISKVNNDCKQTRDRRFIMLLSILLMNPLVCLEKYESGVKFVNSFVS